MHTQPVRASNADLLKQIADIQERLSQTEARLEHFVSHDRLYPTVGCQFCEVRRAA